MSKDFTGSQKNFASSTFENDLSEIMKNFIYLKIKIVAVFCLLFLFNIAISSCKVDADSSVQLNNVVNSNSNVVNSNSNIDKTIVSELERNRELWTKSNICSYEMTFEASEAGPFCCSPTEIKVRNGVILSIESKTGKISQTAREMIESSFDKYLTVEKLFDFIEQKTAEIKKNSDSRKNSHESFNVNYDSALGYPKQITYRSLAVDGDMSFGMKKLEVISSQNSCN